MSNYSILLSVYYKEKPEWLKEALESALNQTVKTNDFVIVCDGPLTEGLDNVLEEYKNKYDCITLVRLEKNSGLAKALVAGLEKVKNDIVMRIDSDDISFPDRAEKQLALMDKYDVVSGWVCDFNKDENSIVGIRKIPEHYKEIKKFSKKRCPFNHPATMFKKSTVLKAGNYQHLLYCEDYFLWIRLLQTTEKVYNIQEPIVKMRTNYDMIARRGSKESLRSKHTLGKYMYKTKYINWFQYQSFKMTHRIFYYCPVFIQKIAYRDFLHRK